MEKALSKIRDILNKAVMAWGLGLGGAVTLDPEKPTLPPQGAVVLRPPCVLST